MNKRLVGGLAVVVIAAGVLTIVTAAVMSNRGSSHGGSGGSSSDGNKFVHGTEWAEHDAIEYFQLTERSGAQFDSRSLDGKVWVASFFFASCPSTCRQQNETIERLHRQWGPKDVTFVSITCDPTNDTTEVLREYAHRFHAHPDHWKFLTGEFEHIQLIGSTKVLGVGVEEKSHRNSLTLVDRWGKVRGTFDWSNAEELAELEKSLGVLLAEQQPPVEIQRDPTVADADEDGIPDSVDKFIDVKPADETESDSTATPATARSGDEVKVGDP